jgi:hypothetical protein
MKNQRLKLKELRLNNNSSNNSKLKVSSKDLNQLLFKIAMELIF